jgi:hypothetical protein
MCHNINVLGFVHDPHCTDKFKGAFSQKDAEIRVWDVSLDPNYKQLVVFKLCFKNQFSFKRKAQCWNLGIRGANPQYST